MASSPPTKGFGFTAWLVIALVTLLVAGAVLVRLLDASAPGSGENVGIPFRPTLEASASQPADESSSANPGPIRPGSVAPDFSLADPEGRTFSLADWRGSAVMVNFWATWCGPCAVEMPAIEEVYQAHHQEGLVVAAVAVDDTAANTRRFFSEHQLSFQPLVDEKGDVARKYLVFGVPSSVFIGRDGRITDVHTGMLTKDEIETYVTKALQQE